MAKNGRPKTNITPKHQEMFKALTSGEYDNFALFSCFMNGEPAVAIVAVHHSDDPNDPEPVNILPLFVSITPSMVLTDHAGRKA